MGKSRTLAFELLNQLVFVALVPIVVTIAFFVWQLFPQLQRNIIDEQQTIAGLVVQQVTDRISTAEEQIDLLVRLSEQNISRDQILQGFLDRESDFDSIYFVNLYGAISSIAIKGAKSSDTDLLYKDMDLSHSSLFRNRETVVEEGWSKVFLSVVTGRLSIAHFTSVGTETLVAELSINRLPRLSQQLSDMGILVMILDQDNQLIAHPDPSLSQQQVNLNHVSLLYHPKADGVYSDNFEWQGTEYFGTHVVMPDLGWNVIVAEEEMSIRLELYKVLSNWIISIALIILVVLFIAFRRSSILSKRFSVLNNQAKQIADGKYQTQVVEEGIQEFRALSENVVIMADAISRREESLQAKERELRIVNEELEERVEERTQKLSSTNQELQDTIEALNSTMDQLVQSEKLASLGSLVAGVAHELNTPIGNASMASSSLHDFSLEIQEALKQGKMTKTHLERFLNDALLATGISSRNLERAADLITSFKQVAADQSSSQRREFKMTELMHEILLTIHPQTKKQDVEIKTEVPESIRMDSYPGPLGQVISNLIINAFVHGFEPDESGRVIIMAQVKGQYLELEIEDNGKGMGEAVLGKIFDPFFTTRLGSGGSGLGLHICHNIVQEVLGGTISVSSVLEQGTSFSLRLPLVAPTSEKP